MLYGLLMRYVGVIPISLLYLRRGVFFVEYFINSKMPRSYLKSHTLALRAYATPFQIIFYVYKIYMRSPPAF
jgi:hypothetical protein